MSPCIVTTKRPDSVNVAEMRSRVLSRRAVGTLEEDELKRRLFNWREGDVLSEREQRILDVIRGSAFNPIFDGTIIEVERVTWEFLTRGIWELESTRLELARLANAGDTGSRTLILDAYNARQKEQL